MNKKSGQAGTPVDPVAPNTAHEADTADPGEVDEMKSEQRATQTGKYGSTKAKPFKPASDDGNETQGGGSGANGNGGASNSEEAKDKRLSWIEIELVGEDGKPIVGEKYRITLPDGSVDEGTLDQNGWARVEGFEKGDCQVTFPELDQDAWEYKSSGGSKKKND